MLIARRTTTVLRGGTGSGGGWFGWRFLRVGNQDAADRWAELDFAHHGRRKNVRSYHFERNRAVVVRCWLPGHIGRIIARIVRSGRIGLMHVEHFADMFNAGFARVRYRRRDNTAKQNAD